MTAFHYRTRPEQGLQDAVVLHELLCDVCRTVPVAVHVGPHGPDPDAVARTLGVRFAKDGRQVCGAACEKRANAYPQAPDGTSRDYSVDASGNPHDERINRGQSGQPGARPPKLRCSRVDCGETAEREHAAALGWVRTPDGRVWSSAQCAHMAAGPGPRPPMTPMLQNPDRSAPRPMRAIRAEAAARPERPVNPLLVAREDEPRPARKTTR